MRKIFFKQIIVGVALISLLLSGVRVSAANSVPDKSYNPAQSFIENSVPEEDVSELFDGNDSKQERPSTRAIIGSDDRTIVANTTAAPYRYIGRLVTYYTENTGRKMVGSGTAFLVGPDTLLTAAHCVYPVDEKTGKPFKVTNVVFYPGLNGGAKPYDPVQYKYTDVPTQYKDACIVNKKDYAGERHDYAVVKLKAAIGKSLGYFALADYATAFPGGSADVSDRVTLAGYPGNFGKGDKLYKHTGNAYFNYNGYLIKYKIDMKSGQSGSPMYYKMNNKYHVMGICTSADSGANPQYNYGRFINGVVKRFVKKHL